MQPHLIQLFKWLRVGMITPCFGLCHSGDAMHVWGNWNCHSLCCTGCLASIAYTSDVLAERCFWSSNGNIALAIQTYQDGTASVSRHCGMKGKWTITVIPAQSREQRSTSLGATSITAFHYGAACSNWSIGFFYIYTFRKGWWYTESNNDIPVDRKCSCARRLDQRHSLPL